MPEILEKLGPAHFPLLGNSVAVGFFSLLHIALASLAVAFIIIAPVFESMERESRFHVEVARGLTRFTLVTFTVSTVLAVIMLELFVGLFPLTNVWMFNRFRDPIFFAVAAFFLLLFTLYPYYHYWEPIRRRSRRLHLTLGFAAALFALIWVAVLDGIGSYMLTPTAGQGSGWSLFNPTWIPLMLHRFFGNFVFGGFAICAYAAWMLGRRSRHPDEEYYLHLLKIGFLIGFGALLIQPFTGLFYAAQIGRSAPEAYQQLLRGRYRGWVYLQFILIAGLFIGSHFLLRAGRPAEERDSRLGEGALLLSAGLMVAFVEISAARRLFTLALVALSLFYFSRRRRGWRAAGGDRLNRAGVRGLAIALGIVALFTYWTMGTIREAARRPDTVRGMISLQQEAGAPRFLTRGETPAAAETPPQKGGAPDRPGPRG